MEPTVQRANGRTTERFRLLGADAPGVHESARLERDARSSGQSKEAIKALCRLAWDFSKKRLDREHVGLEFDVQSRGRYGRTLAYGWLPDGLLFNVVILPEGYAQVMSRRT